jgi:hypothetical protein
MDCENKIYFKWSTTVIIITAITTLLLLSTILFINLKGTDTIPALIVYSLLLFALGLVLYLLPVYISYDADEIKIQRLISRIILPVQDILLLKKIDDNNIFWSIRLFGSSGVGGYLGLFSNKKLGTYTMYATQKRNLILIKTIRKKYIVSCEQYDDLLNYYAGKLPVEL